MRRLRACAMAALGALVAGAGAAALSERQLSGTLRIRGSSIVDPPADEAQNTHAAFVLEGAAARALYDALQVAAVADECRGDGSVTKRLGNIACTRGADGATYECDFALDLVHQRITPGQVC